MLRKLAKVLKRRILKGIKGVGAVLIIGSFFIALIALVLGILCIPYAIGYFLISPMPMFEEVSREDCGALCVITTIILSSVIMLGTNFIRYIKNFIEEVKNEE